MDNPFAKLNELLSKVMPTFDKAGQPIDFETYCRFKEDDTYWIIGKDDVRQGEQIVEVSTVWLGISLRRQRDPDAPLWLFETMVFCENGNYCHKYNSEAEALEGHKMIVKAITEGKALPLPDQSLEATIGRLLDMLGEVRSQHK